MMVWALRAPRTTWHALRSVPATASRALALTTRTMAQTTTSRSGSEQPEQHQHQHQRGEITKGLGRMESPQQFLKAVDSNILKKSAKPMPVVIDRALKNLAAPELLNMRPRIKANVGHKIIARAIDMQLDLPVTSYDFYLRLQCSMPDAEHRIPVHAVQQRLQDEGVQPDDVLLFTMMRGYALCGDVPNARKCFNDSSTATDESYAQLALAYAVNGDAAGILDILTEASETPGLKSQATLYASSLAHLAHVGTTQDMETVLGGLEAAGVKLRLSMLDNYLRSLAAKGDLDGVQKLYEWKTSEYSALEDVTQLEEQMMMQVVFGDVQQGRMLLEALIKSDAVQFKPIVNVIDILALRKDAGRLEQFTDLLLAEGSLFKSNFRVQDALASALIHINDFHLSRRILLKIRRQLSTLYGFYHACFECLSQDTSMSVAEKQQHLVTLVEWGTASGFADTREFVTDVFKATAIMPSSTKASVSPLWGELQRSKLVDVSVWNAYLRASRNDHSTTNKTLHMMRDRGMDGLQSIYAARIQIAIEADDSEQAKELAEEAAENMRSTTRTTAIFAPVLKHVVAKQGGIAALEYLEQILRNATRLGLRVTDSLLEAWCEGCVNDEGILDAALKLRDVVLLPGTLAKMLKALAHSGNISGMLDVANGMTTGQFSSDAVNALLSVTILEGGIINEDTLHAIGRLYESKHFMIQDTNWSALLAAAGDSAEKRRQVIDLCKSVFPSEAEALDTLMLSEPLRQAKVDDIVNVLLDLQMAPESKTQLATETLERITTEHPEAAVRLAEELAVDKLLTRATALRVVASHFFAPNFVEQHPDLVKSLITRVVQDGASSAIPNPPNQLFQSVLPNASPRDAARILKFGSETPHSASKIDAMLEGIISLLKNNRKERDAIASELQNLGVVLPSPIPVRVVEKLPSATSVMFPFLPQQTQSRHIGNQAAHSSPDVAAEYLRANPDELANVLISFTLTLHKRGAKIVGPVKKLLGNAGVELTHERMDVLLKRLAPNRPSEQYTALALLQHAGDDLDAAQREQLEQLCQRVSMLSSDSDAVSELLQKHEEAGTTIPLKDFAQLCRSRFQDADFLVGMMKRADKICPHPWENLELVESIIFALSYNRQNKKCLQHMEELLEHYMPLTQPLTESQLHLWTNLYTCTNRPDAAMTVFKRLQQPKERNFIDMARALRDADRTPEAVEILDQYLRTCAAAQKQQMILREMAGHLDAEGFDYIFRACVDTHLMPPPKFIRRHFISLFANQPVSASPRLDEYLQAVGSTPNKLTVVDIFIDAALSTKQFTAAMECMQEHPDLCSEAHAVACSNRAVQFHQHRTVEALARLVSSESYSKTTKEAVMLDRLRVYKQLGQLNEVVETLWADIFATMRPSKEFIRDACAIWEDDATADFEKLQVVLQRHLPADYFQQSS